MQLQNKLNAFSYRKWYEVLLERIAISKWFAPCTPAHICSLSRGYGSPNQQACGRAERTVLSLLEDPPPPTPWPFPGLLEASGLLWFLSTCDVNRHFGSPWQQAGIGSETDVAYCTMQPCAT